MSAPPLPPADNARTASELSTEGTISGRTAIICMFSFALLLSVGMLVYWYINLSTFFPLQKALAAEFPKCTPRVDAGQRKDSPMLLRVILQVPESPQAGNPRSERVVSRSLELIRQHVQLERYGLVQIFLVYREPEKNPQSLRYEFVVEEVLAGKNQPKIVENP